MASSIPVYSKSTNQSKHICDTKPISNQMKIKIELMKSNMFPASENAHYVSLHLNKQKRVWQTLCIYSKNDAFLFFATDISVLSYF